MMNTKLIILMFHRVHDSSQQFDKDIFEQYLQYLSENFSFSMPGDALSTQKTNICLSFDDAYCDFYFYAYPLLKKYNARALLGVSTDYIVEETTQNAQTRLSVPYPKGMENDIWRTQVPFCTWQELREMSNSPYVTIASHSASHPHVTDKNCDLQKEIVGSKIILEQQLQKKVDCFIYPYGDFNTSAHHFVKQHYAWDFRIGSALNHGWQKKGPLYRLDAEKHWPQKLPLTPQLFYKLNMKYWLNRLRGR